jgi:hypothetical protein
MSPQMLQSKTATDLEIKCCFKGTVNSKLGNAGYSTKIEALKVAEFSLTRESAKYPEWDDKSISDRQKKLAELALKTWPINSK